MADTRCPECGRAAGPDDRFCSGCGTALGERGRATPARDQRASLEQMFAHLRSGEQRPATVLMSDITGFSSLGARTDPEWLFNLIDDVLGELAECLVGHGAHIDKFVGDEVMALFGVPMAQERSTERALLAALAMRDRMRSLNDEGRFGEEQLQIHTGINVGGVMAGPIGRGTHTDYTVIGDTVNVAKRLEDEAPPGEIYVSGAVCDTVDEAFEFEPVGPLTLAGIGRAVEVFRLVRADQALLSQRDAVGDRQHGVARERELQRMSGYAAGACDGSSTTVCVVGPPGIGKTHLINEWRESTSGSGFRTISTSCHTCSSYFPLLPLADLVARLVGLQLRGWPPAVVGDVDAALMALPMSDRARDVIAQMLRMVEDAPDEEMEDLPRRIAEALAEPLEALSRTRPLCLIIEDADWLDEASAAVVAELVKVLRGCLLLVLSARDPVPNWMDGLDVPSIHLHRLPQSAMRQLVEGWAGADGLPRSTVEAICNRADGHPHFARELVRCLHDPRGDWSSGDAGLPSSLHELFLSQLDGLALPVRRVVQAAAIIGEPLSIDMLPAVLEDPAIVQQRLHEIIKEGLLRRGSTPDQFVFGRRLLFEVAYNTIPPTQRRKLHARTVEHLVGRMTEASDAAIHTAAHHAYLGWGDERAIDLLLRSARAYKAQYAARQAIKASLRAIELTAATAEAGTVCDRRLEALLLLAQCHEVSGDLDEAEAALAEAEVLAEECTNRELRAQVLTAAGTLGLMRGELDAAESRFADALVIWTELASATRAAHIRVGMGLCASQRGDRARAIELFGAASATDDAEVWVVAAAENNLGVMLMEEGRYAGAEAHLAGGLEANQLAGDRRGVAQSRCSLGELYYRLGRLDQAEIALGEAIADAEEIEDIQCLTQSQAWLRRVYCLRGQQLAQSVAMERPDSASVSPDAMAIDHLACAEELLAFGDDDEVDAFLADPGTVEGAADTGAACANAEAELLAIGLGAALLRGQADLAERLSRDLTQALDHAIDHEVIAYARWLLELQRDPSAVLATQQDETTPPQTCFHMRMSALTSAITDARRPP